MSAFVYGKFDWKFMLKSADIVGWILRQTQIEMDQSEYRIVSQSQRRHESADSVVSFQPAI